MTRIGIIIGSTRPGRNGETVARWVHDIASKRSDAEYELVDIKHFNLPHLDEMAPPSLGQYTQPHTVAKSLSGSQQFQPFGWKGPYRCHRSLGASVT